MTRMLCKAHEQIPEPYKFQLRMGLDLQIGHLAIEHFQYTVIVRHQPGHQARPGRRADVVGRIGTGKPHALPRQPVQVWRLENMIRLQNSALHLVSHQKQNIGSITHRYSLHTDGIVVCRCRRYLHRRA
jgi:hypothetical protein